jgi:beta-phosphoglucomutase-like phosphatase (HAD superfamily)
MQAILFDWDGTLADSLAGLYAANVEVMRTFGLPFDETLYRRHFSPDWRLMYERLGVPPERMAEANRLWIEAFDGGRRTTLLPGAGDAVERLSAAGYRLGLVTAGHREIVEPQMTRLGVDRLLPVRVYGDDMHAQKPDPAPLRRAFALLGGGIDPAAAAYVGDTAEDMLMARAVGAHPVGIPSVVGTVEALRAAGAGELAPSVAAWADRVLLGDRLAAQR